MTMLIWMTAKEEFANGVRSVVGTTPQRTIAKKAGVSQTTIHNMQQEILPGTGTLLRFVDRLGLNREEWLSLYIRAKAEEGDYDPYQAFGEGLRRLTGQYGEEAVRRVAATHIPLGNASREHVEQALRDLETDIREELGAR